MRRKIMSKRNPIERSEYINNRYKEYLRSSFQFESDRLQSLFEKQLDDEDLFKGPYVDLNLPFKRGKNLNELISEGVVCQTFKRLGDIDFERPLYSHQEEAIRHICSGHNAVITTGTGSGKTESFLLPILNELTNDIEIGNQEIGIRAIFLYPMNALLNDQIERVRKILADFPDITYGFFTGDTEEAISKNYRVKHAEENNIVIPENELISREEIRNNPPHLLFTNYSMLEYLLISPNDYAIFTPERLSNWKFVILDEAHTYHGALGIELSLLMRRLTGFAPKKPRFILTSATLGEKGKSENEIIEFAHNLTSSDFSIQDIIFSKRIPLREDLVKYTISGSDYQLIKNAKNDLNAIAKVASTYCNIETADIHEYLYELLVHDRHVYDLYKSLKNGSKAVNTILKEFNGTLSSAQLVDLIDLINQSEKNGIGLFDLKYHSFVRPLSGAYVTLGENPNLSLTKTNIIDGFKAFELGNCRYCSSPYIIGKIYKNSSDGIDYLIQNKEIDIYENYGNNESVSLDYFLMDNITDSEIESDALEKFKVCSKCGAIHIANNLNARQCSCDKNFIRSIYRVTQTNDDGNEIVYNNINQCPCCGHKSHSGIVKSLSLGKDEGTALIAQTLYEAIDDCEIQAKKAPKISLKIKDKSVTENSKNNIKQFLAFSDSRQQASFFATFFDSNHTRMLQKRLIWEIIKENNYKNITVDELVARLSKMIKEQDLFPNDMEANKNAWISVLVDLLKVDGSYDSEGLGLYYFDLDLSDIFSQVSEDDVAAEFGQYHITKKDLENIMQVVLGIFKTTPAIDYVKSSLSPEEKRESLDYRRFDNYIMYECPRALNNVRSFLPVKAKDNMVVRYVQKVCECDEGTAKEILHVIFNNLAVEGGILKKHNSKEWYQINVSKYIVKNYKTSPYYICSKCKRLTPYNVHGKCVHDKCDGELREINPDEILASNYYRNQYKNKKIESIVIKEHTAQLERKIAKQYQQNFKNKKINILSCSTTFEMGIDIGNLETVFLRNVPPLPANYVQRAGRAGRRKDSAAYILTYCGTSSHDYTYFCEPEKMISGVIKPPYFNVVNHKIILRHLMAACLGFFFRKHPNYFKNIDEFVFGEGIECFNEFISSRPSDLNRYINERVLPGQQYAEYHNFKWFDDMGGNDEKLQHFADAIKETVDEYKKAQEEALREENYKEADYYKTQIEKLHKLDMISSLSKYSVIPKYGFPVDLVELQIYNQKGKIDTKYDLSRDLKIAISEYAPDSEIIVDKKKYTSKYITLPKSEQFPKHYFCVCPNCKKVNVFVSERTIDECKYCGQSLKAEKAEFYIEPIYGFKTGDTKESTRMKPKRSYSGEISYIGGGIKDDVHIHIGDTIEIETSTNDELLIMNKSAFYMCPECGYSEIIKGNTTSMITSRKHKNYRQFDCSFEELEQIKLGHRFQTDVARFKIPSLSSSTAWDYAAALSFMYAFLEGISNALEVDRNDIDGIIEPNLDLHSYDVLIYDNVPGGAGHVKRLTSKDAVIDSLKAAHDKVSQPCCDENTSCYNCLRNYYNQAYHSKLQRKYARNIIEGLIREIQ